MGVSLNGFTRALVLLVLIGSSEQARSGAWVQSKGAYYLKLSSSYLSTSRELNYRGEGLDLFDEHPGFTDGSFRDFNLTTYAEYGLSERVTMVSNLQYKALRASRTGLIGGGALRYREILHTNGFADLSLSLRYALLVSPLALSLQVAQRYPWVTTKRRRTTALHWAVAKWRVNSTYWLAKASTPYRCTCLPTWATAAGAGA